MSARLWVAIGLGVALGVASAFFLIAGNDRPGTGQTTGTAQIGGPFSLTDTGGARVTDKDFAGKPMLVFFGFTNCPSICPTGLQVITAALDKLGDKAKSLTPVFITLDPERDTPAKLGAYMKNFHSSIRSLSGSADDVTVAVKAYKVYAKKVSDQAQPNSYTIDHTSFVYLMDANGKYLKHFPHSVEPDKLAAEIAAVL